MLTWIYLPHTQEDRSACSFLCHETRRVINYQTNTIVKLYCDYLIKVTSIKIALCTHVLDNSRTQHKKTRKECYNYHCQLSLPKVNAMNKRMVLVTLILLLFKQMIVNGSIILKQSSPHSTVNLNIIHVNDIHSHFEGWN